MVSLNVRNFFRRAILCSLLIFSFTVPAISQEKGKELEFDDSQLKKYPDVEDAIVLFQRGNASGALALLRTAKKKHPDISPPEVMLARLYYSAKKPGLGKNSLQSAVLMYPDDAEAWNILADLQFRSGNWAEAELVFEKAVATARKVKKTSARNTTQIAFGFDGLIKTCEVRGVWKKAESYLLEWKKIDSKNVNVFRRLAASQLKLGKIDDATDSLRQAKKLDPNQLPAEISLGLYHQRQGNTDKAKSAMQKALRDEPASFHTHAAVSRWALSSGDFDLARKCISICARLDEDSLVPKILDASNDLYSGATSSAEEKFRKLIQIKPGDFEVNTGLSMSLLKQDDETKIAQGLEHAKVISNSNKDVRTARGRQALSLLAWALFRNKQFEQSSQLMQQIVKSGEVGPDIAYFAAEIFYQQNRNQLANELVTKALDSPLAFIHRNDAKVLKSKLGKNEAPQK